MSEISISPQTSSSQEIASDRTGYVYAIVPDRLRRPERVKIGWTTNLAERIATYRTLAPDLHVVGLWRAEKQVLEQAALLLAKRHGKRVGGELFDCHRGDHAALFGALSMMFAEFCVVNDAPLTPDFDDGDFEIGGRYERWIGVTNVTARWLSAPWAWGQSSDCYNKEAPQKERVKD